MKTIRIDIMSKNRKNPGKKTAKSKNQKHINPVPWKNSIRHAASRK